MPATPGSDQTAVSQLALATQVPEPPNIQYEFLPTCWNYRGQIPHKKFHFGNRMTAARLDLNTTQASTVEVDLEDDDFTVLGNELFVNWAFNIEDVSLDSFRKFNVNKLSSHTDNSYLGDESDLEWVLGQRPIDTVVGNVYFRLCAINSSQETVTLQFEDRAASYLRAKSGKLSWDRSQHTRAQFVAMLCRQAGCEYFIPEIDVKQPQLANKQTGSSVTTSPTASSHGISSMANLTVKGSPMNATQRKIATTICQIGEQLSAPADAVVAVLFDCIYESGMGIDTTSNGAYGGVLGGSVQTFAANLSSATAEITSAFKGGNGYTSAIDLAKNNAGKIAFIGSQCTRPIPFDSSGISTQYEAQTVPGGINGTVSEATQIFAAYGGVSETKSSTTLTTSSDTAYAFTRGANEDSWDCIQRLAEEVGWYAFARQNTLWFVSGNYLFSQDSQMVVECGLNGVSWIDVDLAMGARDQTAEVDVYARTDFWTALPGMMVSVGNRGPATGKWMVSEVAATLLDPTQEAEITCYKPVPKQSEPVDDTTAVAAPGTLTTGLATVLDAFAAAQALSAKQTLYTQGLRTLKFLGQIQQGETIYDCSSATGEVLLLAGFKLPGGLTYGDDGPTTASDWGSVMQQGPGKQMTIWIRPFGTQAHMFIEFNIPSKGHYQGNVNVEGQASGFRLAKWGPFASTDAVPGGAFAPFHYTGT